MSQVVNVNTLPQIGRPATSQATLSPTSIRFSQIVTATPINFIFPQGAGTNFTFGIPQYMFVDNSFNTFEMVVSVQGTSYSFPVPALSSGYYRVDAIDGDTIMVTSAGVSSDLVEIVFYNYTLAPIVWYKNQSTSTAVTIADGADAAQGSVADAAVTNPALNATVIALLKGILTELLGGGGGLASKVQGLAASGAVPSGNPVYTAGFDGTHVQPLATDTTGHLSFISADGAQVTIGAEADAAITNPASSGTLMAFTKGVLSELITGFGNVVTAIGGTLKTVGTSPYVNNAVPITATSGVVSNASAVATLAGTVGKTTYISGFDITSDGATAVSVVTAVLSGTISGSQSYVYTAVAGATTQDLTLTLSFNPPVPASAVNTAIVVTLPALGAGNTAACVNARGFQL